ncbi:type II toxin-antitoxin system PemK/MazF family toxin [Lacticaseibacillus paracasei]|uniref:type II toxin-antitoxin system PemK/MazF family toxin n=1 Tax=Lacticaseibacillus paracasei TaxID=1597 RepID=UPI0007BECB2B|nr:type II toxin-antitoxin system PemK/MazF family toxin [Lacticaseibacillus paracasei]
MNSDNQIPRQGDLIWIDSEPHAGHEYGGHNASLGNTYRPMLVVSDAAYNQRTGMIVGFPITHATKIKAPFRIELSNHKISGYVILTGLLGYDYIVRSGKIADHASAREIAQAMNAVKDIFGLFD